MDNSLLHVTSKPTSSTPNKKYSVSSEASSKERTDDSPAEAVVSTKQSPPSSPIKDPPQKVGETSTDKQSGFKESPTKQSSPSSPIIELPPEIKTSEGEPSLEAVKTSGCEPSPDEDPHTKREVTLMQFYWFISDLTYKFLLAMGGYVGFFVQQKAWKELKELKIMMICIEIIGFLAHTWFVKEYFLLSSNRTAFKFAWSIVINISMCGVVAGVTGKLFFGDLLAHLFSLQWSLLLVWFVYKKWKTIFHKNNV